MKRLLALALAACLALPLAAGAQQNGMTKDKNGNWVKSEAAVAAEKAQKKAGGGGGSRCNAVSSQGCPACQVSCPEGRTAQCQLGSGHCTSDGTCFCNSPPSCRCL